jgi:membrane protein YqaA with SNARE-associated domain
MTDYLILFGIVFAIHLAPALTPPTWPVIVLYSLNSHLPMQWLVLTAAIAAALGRHVLALLANAFEHWFPKKLQRNIDAARELIERRPANRILALGLFVFAPVPSAQLFEAAGLLGLRLWPCTLAFFMGRLGYYTLYAFTARQLRSTSLAANFRESLTSPIGILVQVALIAVLIVLIRTDWSRFLRRRP